MEGQLPRDQLPVLKLRMRSPSTTRLSSSTAAHAPLALAASSAVPHPFRQQRLSSFLISAGMVLFFTRGCSNLMTCGQRDSASREIWNIASL